MSHAVMELIEDISNATDNKKHAIGAFSDLKKGLRYSGPRNTYQKFNFYGVRGVGHDWLKSDLTNRKQLVEVNRCASELLNVTLGVPQVFIIGPKLFVLYINDICNVSKLAKFIFFFADDRNIFCAGNNLKELKGMINEVLAKLAKWFAVNKLTLNLSKTNYMIFQNNPPDI